MLELTVYLFLGHRVIDISYMHAKKIAQDDCSRRMLDGFGKG